MEFENPIFYIEDKPYIAFSDKYATYIDNEYLRTIDQVYNLAKDEHIIIRNGYQDINELISENELIDIAEYNPAVDSGEYLEIRTMFNNLYKIQNNNDNKLMDNRKYIIDTYLNKSEIKDKIISKYPELKSVEDSITVHDAFLYSIGAKNNLLTVLDDKIIRYKKFLDSKYVATPLLIKLYGSEQEYINRFNNQSILEEYIFAYDENITDYNVLMSIAYRLGISINTNYDIADYLYDSLQYVIDNKPDEDTLKRVINGTDNNRLIQYIDNITKL